MEEGEKIIQVNIEDQMKSAYIDYSMSVIVSRALPDVRDGLKPVHRRILYAMWDLGITSGKPHKKSARIVGDVLGKYHPHGDTAVYDSMVRMAQHWSLRYPFIDGQGNFGSVDGDSPAAMRYTEARMRKIAEEMLVDIEKETVDFSNNFDDSLQEPTVLPSKIPSLLINGSSGIAVGMATNMPPHNLSEVCDGIVAYVDNQDITIPELMEYVKAPDFPTSCVIYGYDGVREAFETGRGRVVMRGDATIDEDSNRTTITVTTLPYLTNPSDMIRRTVELIREDKIDGISNIENLSSDKNGTKIIYELKKDAVPNVVLNKLYQYTALQSSFSVNNIALVGGRPVSLNLKDLIAEFVKHRMEVVIRRSQFELRKAKERAHILEGLLKALDIIDEIIALIRASKTVADAVQELMAKYDFSEKQASAIVEMRLRQLVGLERDRLQAEYDELIKKITYLEQVLSDEQLRKEIIKEETLEMKLKYGDERKSRIEYSASDFRIEDTIADDEVVITISHLGYIKRTLLSEYRVQHRGGKGSKASASRDEDFIEHLYIATNHNYLLFFTEKGKCFWLRVFEIPEGSKTSKGRAIQNLINIESDDKIRAVINVDNLSDTDYINNNYIILCSEKGIIKKTSLEAYSRPRQNGIIAITIKDDDHLLEAKLTNGNSEIMMAIHSGKAIRFSEKTVRPMGRNAMGVKGITLGHPDDYVVGMICVDNDQYDILVVSENGYGKRSPLEDYRATNRGGKGVKTISITEKTGGLIAIKNVTDEDDLMIINRSGIAIRLHVDQLRVMGRATQGVKLINLNEEDIIAAVSQVPREDDEDEEENGTITDATENMDSVENTENDETDSNSENE
ncbi:MAG TPA: DNA gyrase subunit A [Bacteroidales bacterium]|nr:DNA gyrase subunit A [Bacteroidales bacterium]HOH22987.1 DNA gyrase subunit A [Bacteroidales bacterium]HPZ03650.1 DNA gyrase subunit A [Bacteroidales bacterium]HQB75251.1 DNA gyrase subunit A [Bacteroidales bacterium]